MAKTKYRVVRGHEGDRWYDEGEIRTADAADVKHLVPHVLEPVGAAKAEKAAPKNKALSAAPVNKAS